jgi:hypothetical protein
MQHVISVVTSDSAERTYRGLFREFD